MHRSKWAIGFVMMILGLLITTQFKVARQQQASDPGRLRADELAVALQAAEKALRASEAERQKLASELDLLRKSAPSAPVAPPPRDVTALELLAGTTEVQGHGVVITMTEASEAPSGQNRLSDEDIWRVLNELLSAGAEGLAVNGTRITSVTGIRNVGNRIMVDRTMTNTPIEILAIGDPQVLEASLKLRGGVIEYMGRWGIKVTVTKSNTVRLPPARALPEFLYAKPVKKP